MDSLNVFTLKDGAAYINTVNFHIILKHENTKNIWLTAREYSIKNTGVPKQKCVLPNVPRFEKRFENHWSRQRTLNLRWFLCFFSPSNFTGCSQILLTVLVIL